MNKWEFYDFPANGTGTVTVADVIKFVTERGLNPEDVEIDGAYDGQIGLSWLKENQ